MTTIQISSELQRELAKLKISDGETYEDILWDLVEDRKELSEETKRQVEQARKDIAAGKGISLAEAKRRLGVQ